MSLRAEIEAFREPITRGVSNLSHPLNHSCDNSPLFTAVYLSLLSPEERFLEQAWFTSYCHSLEVRPGLYSRYPGDLSLERQDNPTGIASAFYQMGVHAPLWNLYEWGRSHHWSWNNVKPEEFSWNTYNRRFTGYVPFLKYAALGKMNWFDIQESKLPYYANTFEKREETSGKILLWLRSKVLLGIDPSLDRAILFWKLKMMNQYSNGLKDVLSIYFGPDHALVKYAPLDFN